MTYKAFLLAAAVIAAPVWAADGAADNSSRRGDEEIVVTGQRKAGIATNGGVGLLGNKDRMDTPFSQTVYTEELIDNIQAKTLAEILEANPSVNRLTGRFFSNDGFFIRGFPIFGTDLSYDGLYGLTNVRRSGIVQIERVELLKGPSALLNGVPPSGGIGGTANLVPKRAGDKPVTTVDLTYLEELNFGGSLDIGRRFGAEGAFGARANVLYRDGSTTLDGHKEREGIAALSLDYRKGPVRLFATGNYEDVRNDAAVFSGFNLTAGLAVPKAPDGSTNPTPPFTYTKTERNFGTTRAESDLAEGWTASLGFGWQNVDETQYVTFGSFIINAIGDVREPTNFRLGYTDRENNVIDAKLRGEFSTGPISHQIAANAYRLTLETVSRTATRAGSGALSNLYNLRYNYAAPSFATAVFAPSSTKQTLEGVAVSDTLSAADGRIQLTAGARRQTLRQRNRLTNVTSYDQSATTPAFALLVRPIPQLSFYGNYIQGLQQAPAPPTTAINFLDVFPPGKSKQKEIGAKFELSALSGSLALFEITQPSGLTNTTTLIFSVDGKQRNKGIELELFGNLGKRVRLIGGATYLDAKLVRTQGGINNGKTAVNVPDLTVSANLEWDVAQLPGLTLNARAIGITSRFLDVQNRQEVDGWTRFDAGMRYGFTASGQPVTLRAQVTNVGNRRYWESANGVLIPAAPRTASLSASVAF